jgi:hypothetical protein
MRGLYRSRTRSFSRKSRGKPSSSNRFSLSISSSMDIFISERIPNRPLCRRSRPLSPRPSPIPTRDLFIHPSLGQQLIIDTRTPRLWSRDIRMLLSWSKDSTTLLLWNRGIKTHLLWNRGIKAPRLWSTDIRMPPWITGARILLLWNKDIIILPSWSKDDVNLLAWNRGIKILL